MSMAFDTRISMEEEEEPRFTRPTRTINLVVDKAKNMSLGFNIRGGSEFNLAIYVSGVTPDSLAEAAGLLIGDQILSVNGRTFESITHQDAVDFILSFSNLSIVVIATGKVPDEEQPFGKHVFITGTGEKIVEQYNINGSVGGSSDAHSDYVIKMPPPPIQDEILNPIPLYETKSRDSMHIDGLEESIVPVDQSESAVLQSSGASAVVDIYDTSDSMGGSLPVKEKNVEPPTEYYHQEDDRAEAEADAVVVIADPHPSSAPSRTDMKINLLTTRRDETPSDEEALIALTPIDHVAPSFPSTVSAPPQIIENIISEDRISIGSNSSKNSGKSAEGKKKKKKKSTVSAGSKLGSLKFGSLRVSKSHEKSNTAEIAAPAPSPQPTDNVLAEIDSNIVVSTSVEGTPANQDPILTHTFSHGGHVMQKNSQNCATSEVIAINRGSPKQKTSSKRSNDGGKGSIRSSDKVDSVRIVSTGGGSVGRHQGIMMSDTTKSYVMVKKEEERGAMIYQRENLVKEVHASLQEVFNEEDLTRIKEAIILYHRHETVEDFLNRILPLFTPLKFKLLRVVRKIVYADEVIMYDGLVTSYLGRKKREVITGGRTLQLKSMWAEDTPIARQPVVGAASTFGRSSVITESESTKHSSPLPQPESVENKVIVTPMINTYQGMETPAAAPPMYDYVETDHTVAVTHKTQYGATDVETLPTQTETKVIAEKTEVGILASPVEGATVTIVPEQVVSESDEDVPARLPDMERSVEKTHLPIRNDVDIECESSSAEVNSPSVSSSRSSSAKGSLRNRKKISRESGTRVAPNKPYITVEKKISGEHAGLVSVYTGNGDGSSETLVFQNATYDNSLNAVAFNASLKLEPPPNDKPVSITSASIECVDVVDARSAAPSDTVIEETSFNHDKEGVKARSQHYYYEPRTTEEVSVTPGASTQEGSMAPYTVETAQISTDDSSVLSTDVSTQRVSEVSNPTYDSFDAIPNTQPQLTDSNSSKNEIDLTDGNRFGNRNSIDDTNVAPLAEITHRTCHIDKSHRLIGMTISGGSDSEYQSAIHVIKIVPNAAADRAGIRVGNVLISINENSLLGVTHAEACRLIKTAFKDKSSQLMAVCVMEDQDP